MKKYKFIFAVVWLALFVLSTRFLFMVSVVEPLAQICTNDADDPGNCDTLWVERVNGRCFPDTELIIHVSAFHDEPLAGVSIPLIYKNPQTNIFLDSAKLTPFPGMTADTVIDRITGTIIYFFVGLTGGTVPPGTDTFMTLYFRTGPAWDPSVINPIDTFSLPSGKSLSFADTSGNDIQPVYDSQGRLFRSKRWFSVRQ